MIGGYKTLFFNIHTAVFLLSPERTSAHHHNMEVSRPKHNFFFTSQYPLQQLQKTLL